MRIAGIRLDASVARLLVTILEGAGFQDTAFKIADAMERQVTTDAPLTIADYQAILQALGASCPPTLDRLRRELLEDQRLVRRITGQ